MHQRRRTIHAIEIAHLFGDRNELVGCVQLLLGKLGAEDRLEISNAHRFECGRIQDGRMIGVHERANVQPCFGQLIFRKIRFVFGTGSVSHVFSFPKPGHKKTPCLLQRFRAGTRAKLLRCHHCLMRMHPLMKCTRPKTRTSLLCYGSSRSSLLGFHPFAKTLRGPLASSFTARLPPPLAL
ncbi:unknown [Eggerthella sp. CAG:298]|nr:unknown [Eggerthella sp. CAG:298]